MSQESLAPKNGRIFLSVVSRWQESLKWRIAFTYGGVMVVLGLLIVAIVYQSIGRALRSQLDRQASMIATNLSDVAAGYIAAKQTLGLYAYVAKYARLDGVAYTFIEDRTGEVVANHLRPFPLELLQPLSSDQRRQVQRVTRKYQGKTVYETRVPILEGQLGTVHLAIWEEFVEQEVKRALLPIVGLVAAAVLSGFVLSILLAHGIVRPIRQLTDVAGKISTGDLETPIALDSRDEVGELARSLERMRASLKTAIWRLNRAS